MGSPYGPRELVAVVPYTGATWKYGFNTTTKEAEQTALGQTDAIVNGDYIAGLVIGVNRPKPPRATRKGSATDTGSTYCGADAIATAKAAGWRVKVPLRRGGRSGAKSKTVYVTVGEIDADGQPVGPQFKYAWPMPLFLYNRIIAADRTALGIEDATASDTDLIFGADYPKPPRASFIATPTSGASNTLTTFVDPNKIDNLPSGWSAA